MESQEFIISDDRVVPLRDNFIAVNEAGRLRSKPPMRAPDTPYRESYQRGNPERTHRVFHSRGAERPAQSRLTN